MTVWAAQEVTCGRLALRQVMPLSNWYVSAAIGYGASLSIVSTHIISSRVYPCHSTRHASWRLVQMVDYTSPAIPGSRIWRVSVASSDKN